MYSTDGADRHQAVGALNFYSRSPASFSDDEVNIALQFATQAAIVLANSQAYWDAHQLGQDMAEAMKFRATIEQAKGILMAAQRCSAEEAFQILVRASQREKRKLREMAAEIVARTTDPCGVRSPPGTEAETVAAQVGLCGRPIRSRTRRRHRKSPVPASS